MSRINQKDSVRWYEMANLAYCRVSKNEQTTENQLKEIRDAGYVIEPEFVFCDEVSGSAPHATRKNFKHLIDHCRKGDVLIVTKLDRLGRDQMDIQHSIRAIQAKKVGIVVLQLGNIDLSSTAGKLVVTILAAVAEMELDLIRERTLAGLARAKEQGRRLGKRRLEETDKGRLVISLLAAGGSSIRQIARQVGCSPTTVMAIKKRNV